MRILLAPHNDDEALFASYIIMRMRPLVIVVTDGMIHQLRGIATREQCRKESIDAMAILQAPVAFLGIDDTKLTKQILIERLRPLCDQSKECVVYAPEVIENGNEQHNIVGQVADILWGDKVVHYSTYTKDDLTPRGKIAVVPSEEEALIKVAALRWYKSQLKCNGPHFDAVVGENEYISHPDDCQT